MSSERTIRLVRHGRAAAGWGTDPDPDLDSVGRQQANDAASTLVALDLSAAVSSPLLRCRSTADAYADLAGVPVSIAPDVAEIPSPAGVDMADRVDWLRAAMQGDWADLGQRYTDYRDSVLEYVRSCGDGTVIFSHFIAINTVIGECLGNDLLVSRSVDNCSISTVVVESDQMYLVEGGREADTLIR